MTAARLIFNPGDLFIIDPVRLFLFFINRQKGLAGESPILLSCISQVIIGTRPESLGWPVGVWSMFLSAFFAPSFCHPLPSPSGSSER